MSSIEDALYRMGYLRSGADLTITRKGPNGWQRANCPKCGYERAQVHSARGLFWCPKIDQGKACLKVAVKRDWSVIDQFAEMGRKVAGNASVRKYGGWLEPLEIAQVCEELLLEYARNGDLDKWESAVGGDPGKLRGYVFTALRGDVLNYARDKTARIRQGHAPDVEYMPGDDAMKAATAAPWQRPALVRTAVRPLSGEREAGTARYKDQEGKTTTAKRVFGRDAAPQVTEAERYGNLTQYPTLAMFYAGMKPADIAKVERVSPAAIRKRIQRETERYRRRHHLW